MRRTLLPIFFPALAKPGIDNLVNLIYITTMIRLDGRHQYFLLDTNAEVFTRHDSTDTIMKQLVTRKSTGHLLVVVAKGEKSRLVPVTGDLLDFNHKLHETMAGL